MFENLGRSWLCKRPRERQKSKLARSVLLQTLKIISIFSYTSLVRAALDTSCSAGEYLRGGGVCTPCPQGRYLLFKTINSQNPPFYYPTK